MSTRTRTQYGQDYAPKYEVGRAVVTHEGMQGERRGTITARRVYRDRAHPRGDTLYSLSDGSSAWEWSLSPIVDEVSPEVAMGRIVESFGDRLIYSALTTARTPDLYTWGVHIHLEVLHSPADGGCERVDIRTTSTTPRMVDTCREGWRWTIGDHAQGNADNLGRAIVDTYNGSMEGVSE